MKGTKSGAIVALCLPIVVALVVAAGCGSSSSS
jgi:hypothetical protein